MSDSGEKHFEPTQQRIARAKREGNTPRSSELGANAAFAGATLAACALSPAIGAAFAGALRGSLASTFAIVGFAVVPVAAGAAAASAVGVVQNGGVQFVAVVPKFERLNPAEGFKRMFSREAVTHGARACVAFVCAGAAIVPLLRDAFVVSGGAGNFLAVAAAAWSSAQHAIATTIAVGACFAVGEYAVARGAWLKKLRMSYAEFKRELKENDGDPLTRSRRKSLHRSLVRGSLSRVKDASFVVVNPTHVAVALEYRPPQVPVPTVLVRAVDEGARRVRELATELRVPIVENAALARALFADTRVGDPIGHVHYVAVAEIVAALTAGPR